MANVIHSSEAVIGLHARAPHVARPWARRLGRAALEAAVLAALFAGASAIALIPTFAALWRHMP